MIKFFNEIKKLKYKYNLSYNTIYIICRDSNTDEEIIEKLEKIKQDFNKLEETEREKKINRIIELVNGTFDFTIANDCLDLFPKWTMFENKDYCVIGLIESYDDIYWLCVNKDNYKKFICLPCYAHLDESTCTKKFNQKEIDTIIKNHEEIINHDKERMIYNCLIDKIYD